MLQRLTLQNLSQILTHPFFARGLGGTVGLDSEIASRQLSPRRNYGESSCIILIIWQENIGFPDRMM